MLKKKDFDWPVGTPKMYPGHHFNGQNFYGYLMMLHLVTLFSSSKLIAFLAWMKRAGKN